MRKIPIVWIWVGAVFLGAGVSAAEEEKQAAPTVEIPDKGVDAERGDEWIYQAQDSLTGAALSNIDVVVVSRQAQSIDVRMRVVAANSGLTSVGAASFDPFWRRLPDSISPGSGAQESWGVRPKLRAGDDWTYNFERQLSGSSVMMGWTGYGQVLGVERIDLPNGRTVDAMKIEFLERPTVARYRFKLRVIEWFAPEINRYVRREVETRQAGQLAEATTEILQDYVRRR